MQVFFNLFLTKKIINLNEKGYSCIYLVLINEKQILTHQLTRLITS